MKTFLRTASFLTLATCSVTALAGTAADDIAVSATVVSSCSISATDIAFGNYDPIVANASTPIDRTSTISTKCTIGSTPTLNIGASGNDNGDRNMAKGADLLNYGLYSDNTHTTAWPAPGVAGVAATTPTGNTETNTVYAQLPAGQNDAPIGVYNENVTITVTF